MDGKTSALHTPVLFLTEFWPPPQKKQQQQRKTTTTTGTGEVGLDPRQYGIVFASNRICACRLREGGEHRRGGGGRWLRSTFHANANPFKCQGSTLPSALNQLNPLVSDLWKPLFPASIPPVFVTRWSWGNTQLYRVLQKKDQYYVYHNGVRLYHANQGRHSFNQMWCIPLFHSLWNSRATFGYTWCLIK